MATHRQRPLAAISRESKVYLQDITIVGEEVHKDPNQTKRIDVLDSEEKLGERFPEIRRKQIPEKLNFFERQGNGIMRDDLHYSIQRVIYVSADGPRVAIDLTYQEFVTFGRPKKLSFKGTISPLFRP